ncbi:hypothetical protein AUR67_07815 [Pseudoalteromonas sp. XI10]|uniref:hypothetical protein n=1 Tax=Pseudoalteromonas TaxID=53246 RepID=UPI0007339634|nr:hypothetical protein [Pseudoalteromonas sp. XI10]KTG21236.1 hypothetical protein AUR67_07815 [Pseudoalteromonas sp. XI10]
MKKNEILIIESRGALDHFDDRYEAATLKDVLNLQRVRAKHVEVVNKEYLAKALKLAENVNINYVHISAHGCDKGIELTDGDFISWKEFDELAWPYLKGVCICFSSCSVGLGANELFKYHRTFCNAIVAPTREISWGEGIVAFSAFYHRATKEDTSAEQDVKVLNHIVGAGTFKITCSSYNSTTYVVGS